MVFLANEKSIFEFFTQPKFSLSSEPPYAPTQPTIKFTQFLPWNDLKNAPRRQSSPCVAFGLWLGSLDCSPASLPLDRFRLSALFKCRARRRKCEGQRRGQAAKRCDKQRNWGSTCTLVPSMMLASLNAMRGQFPPLPPLPHPHHHHPHHHLVVPLLGDISSSLLLV